MANDDKFYILAMVSVVGIVGIVALFFVSGGSGQGSVMIEKPGASSDLVGQAGERARQGINPAGVQLVHDKSQELHENPIKLLTTVDGASRVKIVKAINGGKSPGDGSDEAAIDVFNRAAINVENQADPGKNYDGAEGTEDANLRLLDAISRGLDPHDTKDEDFSKNVDRDAFRDGRLISTETKNDIDLNVGIYSDTEGFSDTESRNLAERANKKFADSDLDELDSNFDDELLDFIKDLTG
jgi:hypothetical protein